MTPESIAIDPVLSNNEREELRHLDYLSARVRDLRDRGLIAAEVCEAIDADGSERREAIERHGRYQAAMNRARELAARRPDVALSWAERARAIEPGRVEAWELSVSLLWAMESDDEAVALCTEAAGRFPQLGHRREHLAAQLPARAGARRAREEQARRGRELTERLDEARRALQDGRDDEAIALAREVLAGSPLSVDALQVAAYASQRAGRLGEALDLYRSLATLQPSNPAWSEWVRTLRLRERFEGGAGQGLGAGPEGVPVAVAMTAPPPRWSWSSFAAAFLEEHWQKLILCLAVLLIVVSSTVGAHLLLGPMLWQPAGKCALALVWTILFAALGAGLIRWGAERAG